MIALANALALVPRLPEILRRLRGWRAMGCALLGGILAASAHAPLYFWPGMAGGFAILIWLMDGIEGDARRRTRAGFGLGWAFGFGYFLVMVHWIAFAFLDDAKSFGMLAVPAVGLLVAVLACLPGLAMAGAARVWTRDVRRMLVFALAFTLAEWVRGWLFGGFPWNPPGAIWEAGGAVSQAASWVGLSGLSILTVLAMAAPAACVDPRGSFGARAFPAVAAAILFGALWASGASRLAQPLAPPQGPVVRVAAAGFSPNDKWTKYSLQEVVGHYMDLMGRGVETRASVVVMPEGAFPGPIMESPEIADILSANLGNRTLLVGGYRSEQHAGNRLKYYNTLVALTSDGSTIQVNSLYDKNKLVPGGEFIPGWAWLGPVFERIGLRTLQQIGEGFEPGLPPVRMEVPGAPPAGPLICYEAIYANFLPRGPARPNWIVVVSEDAFFGRLIGPIQHFNLSRYRTIEEGLPMARAANGGISGIVDPFGRVVVENRIRSGAVEAPLPALLPPTIYARFGDTAFWFFVVVVGFLAATLPPGAEQQAPLRRGRAHRRANPPQG